jgi:hydroxyacylglutathione hydrolase
MIVKIFVCGPIENNTFVVVCEKTKKALVIDPAFGAFNKVEKYIKENKFFLEKILLTHAHWDHIIDVLLLKNEFSLSIYMQKSDCVLLDSSQASFFSAISIPKFKPDVLLEGDEKIKLGDIEILTIHTPGHTPGCVCYYIEKEKMLFSGDTLFKGSFGRVDLPYSNSEDMINSLKKLSNLPKDVKVYPGHGSETTIGRENWIKNPEKFIK